MPRPSTPYPKEEDGNIMPVFAVKQPRRTKFVRVLNNTDFDITYLPENLTIGRVYKVLQDYPIEIINDQGTPWLLSEEDRTAYWDWALLTSLIGV